jgi:hypothetical protein
MIEMITNPVQDMLDVSRQSTSNEDLKEAVANEREKKYCCPAQGCIF